MSKDDRRTVLLHRHKGRVLSDDDAGRDDLDLLFRNLACAAVAAEEKMLWEAEDKAPWLPEVEARPWIDSLLNGDPRRVWINGKELGERLNLTNAERELRGAWRIHPVEWKGLTAKELKKLRKDRDNARKRRKRAEAGAVPRQVYEAESLSSRKPWIAEGYSRATWYRKRETSVSAIRLLRTTEQPVSSPTKLKRQRATAKAKIKKDARARPPIVSTSDAPVSPTVSTSEQPVQPLMNGGVPMPTNSEWDERNAALGNWGANAVQKKSAVSPPWKKPTTGEIDWKARKIGLADKWQGIIDPALVEGATTLKVH